MLLSGPKLLDPLGAAPRQAFYPSFSRSPVLSNNFFYISADQRILQALSLSLLGYDTN